MKTNGKHKVKFLDPEEGKMLFENAAQHYLKMTGEQFKRKWKAKKIKNLDRPEVMHVASLLPFAR